VREYQHCYTVTSVCSDGHGGECVCDGGECVCDGGVSVTTDASRGGKNAQLHRGRVCPGAGVGQTVERRRITTTSPALHLDDAGSGARDSREPYNFHTGFLYPKILGTSK